MNGASRGRPRRRKTTGVAPAKLVICAWCRRVQRADGTWEAPSDAPRPDAPSHGICPECYVRQLDSLRGA